MTDNTYNGWTNYKTWNVALWIGNTEALYNLACAVWIKDYSDFTAFMLKSKSIGTDDGVAWNDPDLNTAELDDLITEF